MTNSAQNAQAAAATAEDVVSVVFSAADVAAKLLPYALQSANTTYQVGPVTFEVWGSGGDYSVYANNHTPEKLGLAWATLDESGQFKSNYFTIEPSGGWARLDGSLTDYYQGVVTVATPCGHAAIATRMSSSPLPFAAGSSTIKPICRIAGLPCSAYCRTFPMSPCA